MGGKRAVSRCLVLVLLLLLPLSGCGSGDDSLERVQGAGVMRIGLDPTFPPFENGDTGELHGLDVDLGRALAEELGVTAEFVYFGYDGLYDALLTGQVDVLLSALVIDPSRTRDFAYSRPYFNAGQFLVVNGGGMAGIDGLADLAGETVAVELGSDGHLQALEGAERVRELSIRPLPTADDALWLVVQGEAAAAIVDQVSGRLYRRDFPQLRLVEEPLTVEPYALVVRIEDESLLEALNGALRELETDGRLSDITARWLD